MWPRPNQVRSQLCQDESGQARAEPSRQGRAGPQLAKARCSTGPAQDMPQNSWQMMMLLLPRPLADVNLYTGAMQVGFEGAGDLQGGPLQRPG